MTATGRSQRADDQRRPRPTRPAEQGLAKQMVQVKQEAASLLKHSSCFGHGLHCRRLWNLLLRHRLCRRNLDLSWSQPSRTTGGATRLAFLPVGTFFNRSTGHCRARLDIRSELGANPQSLLTMQLAAHAIRTQLAGLGMIAAAGST